MTPTDLTAPARVLAIGAHPDDVEFGCGATLAKWASHGARCEILVLTDGSKGTWDADADVSALVATRVREQEESARLLHVEHVHFGDAVDGELEPTLRARQHVCAVIRAARPDVVLGHDPWKQYRLHPDHRAAGQLTVDAIVAARDPHFFPGAGRAHRPESLLLFEAQVIDHHEVVDEQAARAKVDALLAHKSQWRSTMSIDPSAPTPEVEAQRTAFEARVRAELELAGRAADPPIPMAEAFKLVTGL